MPNKTKPRSQYKEKESIVFREPVAITEDLVNQGNALDAVRTVVGTTPTLVAFPAEAEIAYLRHLDSGVTVWIGSSASITSGGPNTFPLESGDPPLKVRLSAGNENLVYAVVASGTTNLHVLGVSNL